MSERKFNVGDRVRVIGGQRWRGMVCTIIRDLELTNMTFENGNRKTLMAYRTDIKPDPGFAGVSFRPEYLEPYYDGDEPAKWADLADIWKPAGVRA